MDGPGGLFKLNRRVDFAVHGVDPDKTSIVCKAVVEDMGFLFRVVYSGKRDALPDPRLMQLRNV